MSEYHEVVALTRQGERNLPLLRALRCRFERRMSAERLFRSVSEFNTLPYIRSVCPIVIKYASILGCFIVIRTSLFYMYHNNVERVCYGRECT